MNRFNVVKVLLVVLISHSHLDTTIFVSSQRTECGEKKQEGIWPWNAALVFINGFDTKYVCGATLISKSFVVTAAFCLQKKGKPRRTQDISLQFGINVLYDYAPQFQSRRGKEIYVHENYNASSFNNTIALIELDRPVDISDYVRPICLWNDDNGKFEKIIGRIGVSVGWSAIGLASDKTDLEEISVPIASIEDCLRSNSVFANYLNSRMFCGGFRNGTSLCSGHAGTGLALPKKKNPNIWQLRGIVTFALATTTEVKCDLYNYVIFTDVAKYTDWIMNKMGVKQSNFASLNEENRIKWHAAIYKLNRNDFKFVAAATLISTTHLVTLASLVKSEVRSTENLMVYFGKSQLYQFISPSIQERRVDKIVIHPNYETDSNDNIAVIYLKEPIDVTKHVSPIALPVPNRNNTPDEDVAAVSWNFALANGNINYTPMKITAKKDCPSLTGKNNYCASYSDDIKACEISPGDEMVYYEEQKIYLRGLTNVVKENDCNEIVTFIDIFKYLDFITKILLGINVDVIETAHIRTNVLWDNSQCGISIFSGTPFIRKGFQTRPGQWPWHVAIYRSEEIDPAFSCSGTLLSNKFVITAAHCLTKTNSADLVDINLLQLYLGLHRLGQLTSNVQWHLPVELQVHPEYNATTFYNDIGLIKLQREATFNEYVRPICLWEDESDIHTLTDRYGVVTGWGLTEDNVNSKVLMMANLPVVGITPCLTSDRKFFSTYIHENNFCAGYRNGTTVCSGDSGGGLIFLKNNKQDVWQIRGIVSVGATVPGTTVCHPNHYVIFTDIVKYINWIKTKMQ